MDAGSGLGVHLGGLGGIGRRGGVMVDAKVTKRVVSQSVTVWLACAVGRQQPGLSTRWTAEALYIQKRRCDACMRKLST